MDLDGGAGAPPPRLCVWAGSRCRSPLDARMCLQWKKRKQKLSSHTCGLHVYVFPLQK